MWPTAEHESARKPASRDTKDGWTGRMDTECVDTEDLKVFVSGYAGFGVFRVSPAGALSNPPFDGDFGEGAEIHEKTEFAVR